MIGAVNHTGGSYVSTPSGGVKTEAWEIDTQTGVKTYTYGERAGQTEQVMPAKNTTQYATSSGSGNNNTLLYILLAVAGVGVVYFTTKRKGKKK